MTGDSFLTALRAIVGHRNVLTHPNQTRRFRTGYRFGDGDVLAVVQPGSLVEQWRVLQLCISAGKIIIMQAANTGLTGGSTPDGNDYDRDVVLINTMRMKTVHLIDEEVARHEQLHPRLERTPLMALAIQPAGGAP